MVKKGDTLIEVTLAVGIFSMVAIAIVAVLNNSISGAQSSLEATLAREEIDAQAEALRFIQSSAIADDDSSNGSPYAALWNNITKLANTPSKEIVTYAPSSCQELYDSEKDDVFAHNGFVINTRALGSNPNSALIASKDNGSAFVQATTYPRLVYNDDTSNLVNSGSNTNLHSADGLYVIAVKDNSTTSIVDEDGHIKDTPAFYDFYIRACWYGTDANEPSTISTVIRLYDPKAIQGAASGGSTTKGTVDLAYYIDGTTYTATYNRRVKLETFAKKGYSLLGYCIGAAPMGNECQSPEQYYKVGATVVNDDPNTTVSYNLYPIWEEINYVIKYNPNGGSWNDYSQTTREQICKGANADCVLKYGGTGLGDEPKRSGRKFAGWCSGSVSGSTCSGTTYQKGDDIYNILSSNKLSYTFTAIWQDNNETLTIALTWGSTPADLDSHIYGQKSDNSYFHTYYREKTYSEGNTIAALDQDDYNGYGPEIITLNTLGGRNYYYYVYCYSSCSKITGATVKVTNITTGEVNTYYSNNASGSGRYWNVFAYKDGRMVTRQTHSNSPQTDY